MIFKILNFKKCEGYYNINYYKCNQFNYNAIVYFEVDIISSHNRFGNRHI